MNLSRVLKAILMAYFAAWNYNTMTPFQIPAKCLTHVNYAFAKIDNGVIAHGNPKIDTEMRIKNPDWGRPGAPRYFHGAIEAMNHPKGPLSRCNPHLQRVISIGGWEDSDQFSIVARTPEARRKFAQSIIDYIVKHGFHGCELDWEYPIAGGKDTNAVSPDDKQNFVLLLQEIRDHMDLYQRQHESSPMLLTVATAVSKRLTDNLDLIGMSQLVDFFNLMIYDFAGAWENATAHNAPFNPAFVDSIQNYLTRYVAPEKLVTGVPLYGKQFVGAFSKAIGSPYKLVNPPITFDTIQENLTQDKGYSTEWDDQAKAGYLWNEQNKEFVTYEHPNSSFIKAQYVRQKNLLGMFLWELSNDRDAVVLRSVLKGLGLKRSHRQCFC